MPNQGNQKVEGRLWACELLVEREHAGKPTDATNEKGKLWMLRGTPVLEPRHLDKS